MSLTMYTDKIGCMESQFGYYIVAMFLGSIVLTSNPQEKVMCYVEGGRSLLNMIKKAMVRMRMSNNTTTKEHYN